MASPLFAIGTSGVAAARAALDVTAQNIANAGTAGYVRRTVQQSEVAGSNGWQYSRPATGLGVRVDGVRRHADPLQQADVRRTGAEAERAGAVAAGLGRIEAALDDAALFPAFTRFEAALQRLGSDPVNRPLRADALEQARALAASFNLAAGSLTAAGDDLRQAAAAGVDQINQATGDLARVNQQLLRTRPGGGDHAALLDQRDALLGRIAGQAGISVALADNHTAEVRLGGPAGPVLASGTTAAAMAISVASDGTIGFTAGGTAAQVPAGALAGHALALVALRDRRTELDALAAALASTVNTVQTGGAALDGSPGQPLFAGTDAATLSVALASGDGIATAPAGAGAGSRNAGNLAAMRAALTTADIAGQTDRLLFSAASAVAGARTTDEASAAIAGAAATAFDRLAGVDLDQEAANLVRYQQAFQASGKALQAASTIFDTLLALK